MKVELSGTAEMTLAFTTPLAWLVPQSAFLTRSATLPVVGKPRISAKLLAVVSSMVRGPGGYPDAVPATTASVVPHAVCGPAPVAAPRNSGPKP